jgi:excisionase family DNA binding protein
VRAVAAARAEALPTDERRSPVDPLTARSSSNFALREIASPASARKRRQASNACRIDFKATPPNQPPDPRHITNSCRVRFPKPKPGLVGKPVDLTFGRPPHRRLWHGCAVHLAGGEGRPRSGPRGARANCRGRFVLSADVEGMKRNGSPAAFFTERTLAAYLAVSDRTIRNWIRRGDLPSYKLGAARRIDPADVEDFLARNRDEAA